MARVVIKRGVEAELEGAVATTSNALRWCKGLLCRQPALHGFTRRPFDGVKEEDRCSEHGAADEGKLNRQAEIREMGQEQDHQDLVAHVYRVADLAAKDQRSVRERARQPAVMGQRSDQGGAA